MSENAGTKVEGINEKTFDLMVDNIGSRNLVLVEVEVNGREGAEELMLELYGKDEERKFKKNKILAVHYDSVILSNRELDIIVDRIAQAKEYYKKTKK